jgi:LysR family transcriptional regulator, nod-box dependent transcriptional activator
MRFKGLDLNLLVAFDTLLELRNVTRAAERLHLSQAAMSAALGRLREYFADEILVVNGKRMYPTAFAQNLVPQVQDCLRRLSAMLVTSASFDPSTSQRTFRIVASDYVTAVVLVPLISHLATLAPGIRTEVLLPTDSVVKQIENGDVDLLITPEDYASHDLPTALLYEEHHVMAGCRSNTEFTREPSESQFFAAGHVTVAIGNSRTTAFGDRMLESAGKIRRIEVVAPSFTMIPWLLVGTRRLAVMPERLARVMSQQYPIAYFPLPFSIPTMREMVQHHFARDADQGLVWLRHHLQAAAGGNYS